MFMKNTETVFSLGLLCVCVGLNLKKSPIHSFCIFSFFGPKQMLVCDPWPLTSFYMHCRIIAHSFILADQRPVCRIDQNLKQYYYVCGCRVFIFEQCKIFICCFQLAILNRKKYRKKWHVFQFERVEYVCFCLYVFANIAHAFIFYFHHVFFNQNRYSDSLNRTSDSCCCCLFITFHMPFKI